MRLIKLISNIVRTTQNLKLYPFWFTGFLLLIFILAVSFWYSPVLFKGNSIESLGADQLVLSRNYALTGVLGSENNLNVVLAPELVKSSAQPSSSGNKLGAVSYALIFKLFGWQSWNNLVLISVIICAISLVFFTLAAYLAFAPNVALIFPFIFIFLPVNLQTAQWLYVYELAWMYFSLFLVFYFWGRKQKYSIYYLVSAGIFLALACLSKEAFFVFLPIFFVWLIWGKKIKDCLTLFIPVGLILTIFWLPAIWRGTNDYAKLFVSETQTADQYSDFWYYNHIFPDPYSYHFNRQQTIDKLDQDLISQDSSLVYKLDRLKIGKNMGLRPLNLFEWLAVGTNNLLEHISKYFTIEYIGGPMVSLLLVLGFIEMRKRHCDIYRWFLLWLVATPFLIAYIVLASRNHLMDFSFAIAVLVSLGLIGLSETISRQYFADKYRRLIGVSLLALTVYGLILANHVYLGRGYDNNPNLGLQFLADKINQANISNETVIAVGERSSHPVLNYLTGKSVVYFNPNTIKQLVGEHELQDAFDKFNVKYLAGFDASTTEIILENSSTTNIAVWPDVDKLAPVVSDTKSWLMNLVR